MQDRAFFARSDFRFGVLNLVQSVVLAIIELTGIISVCVLMYHAYAHGIRGIDFISVIASAALFSLSVCALTYGLLMFIRARSLMAKADKYMTDATAIHNDAKLASGEMELNKKSFEMFMQNKKNNGNNSTESFEAYGMREKVNSLNIDYSDGAHIEWEQSEMNKGEAICQIETYVQMHARGNPLPDGIFKKWSYFSNMPDNDLRLICKDMVDVQKGKRNIDSIIKRLEKIRKKYESTGR